MTLRLLPALAACVFLSLPLSATTISWGAGGDAVTGVSSFLSADGALTFEVVTGTTFETDNATPISGLGIGAGGRVNNAEVFSITVNPGFNVTLTDALWNGLHPNASGNTTGAERGQYRVNAGGWVEFGPATCTPFPPFAGAACGGNADEALLLALGLSLGEGDAIFFRSSENNAPSSLALRQLNYDLEAVPEPSSLALFGGGLVGLGLITRKFRK